MPGLVIPAPFIANPIVIAIATTKYENGTMCINWMPFASDAPVAPKNARSCSANTIYRIPRTAMNDAFAIIAILAALSALSTLPAPRFCPTITATPVQSPITKTRPNISRRWQMPYAATADVPYSAMIAVIPTNAKLLTPLCTAEGIVTFTISLISCGSNVHFFGKWTGPSFLDGRKYITPIRSSTPIARDATDAYADPAIPNAGRPPRPMISVGFRIMFTMFTPIITNIGVLESPVLWNTVVRIISVTNTNIPISIGERKRAPSAATSGSAPRSRRRSSDQNVPMIARITAKASAR